MWMGLLGDHLIGLPELPRRLTGVLHCYSVPEHLPLLMEMCQLRPDHTVVSCMMEPQSITLGK